MKVLLIDVNCKSSSTGQMVYNLYSYLSEKGYEAAVCYGRGDRVYEKNIYKFGLDWETYLHALLTRITGYTGCFSFFSTKRLIRYIKSFKPDVIHIHELHAYFVNIRQLLDYLSTTNISVVHTLHCEFSYTGKCGHSIECNKWETECGNCPHLRDYPKVVLFDHTKKMFLEKKEGFLNLKKAKYVVPSTWLYKRINRSFLKNQNIRIIHNSIDTNVFCYSDTQDIRKELGIDESKKVILAIAPDLMSDNKGGKYVLELSKRMDDIQFILIGAEESPYNKNNVINLGKIYDKALLAQYYSLADLFVICSKNENFPTTCIEAVCCGTPVVGFDAGGAKEVAPDPVGHFVKYGDVGALEMTIRRELNSEKKLIKDSFDHLRTYYSISRMCEEYLNCYKEDNKI